MIVDITQPDQPMIDQMFDAGGCINDLNDVKLGITYTSQFAYLADGCNGLRVVQLTSPETPGNQGFSPRPTPNADRDAPHAPQRRRRCQSTEALDRDRAVDESGNQIAVFGRVGARPLSREDQQRMYLRPATLRPDGEKVRARPGGSATIRTTAKCFAGPRMCPCQNAVNRSIALTKPGPGDLLAGDARRQPGASLLPAIESQYHAGCASVPRETTPDHNDPPPAASG